MILAWSETGFGQILYLWDKRNKKTLQSKGSSRTECKFCIVSSPAHGGSGLGVMHQEVVHSYGTGHSLSLHCGRLWRVLGRWLMHSESMHEAISVSYCPLPLKEPSPAQLRSGQVSKGSERLCHWLGGLLQTAGVCASWIIPPRSLDWVPQSCADDARFTACCVVVTLGNAATALVLPIWTDPADYMCLTSSFRVSLALSG